MGSSRWQKQHSHFRNIIWGVSGAISILLIFVLLLLGFEIEVAGIFFILAFVSLRILLAFVFNNRFANSMVRILKFDHEAIERDFRFAFKNNNIRYYRKAEDDAYYYEFPGRRLRMTVQPYWVSHDMAPVTKVTLSVVNEKNEAFAETLAGAIDEMEERLAAAGEKV